MVTQGSHDSMELMKLSSTMPSKPKTSRNPAVMVAPTARARSRSARASWSAPSSPRKNDR